MILIIALTGFTAIGSYAQNKSCSCKNKTVHHKTVMHKTTEQQSAASGAWTPEGRYTLRTQAIEPCYQYTKDNIVVTQCDGLFYKNSAITSTFDGYETEGSYMGNYPSIIVMGRGTVKGAVAPQTTINDNGNVPEGGNGFYNSTIK